MGVIAVMPGKPHCSGYNIENLRYEPRCPLDMTARTLTVGIALWFVMSGVVRAQNIDPESSAIWQKVRADLFPGMTLESGDGVVALETPQRAEDAAVVPIAIRAQFPQAEHRYI